MGNAIASTSLNTFFHLPTPSIYLFWYFPLVLYEYLVPCFNSDNHIQLFLHKSKTDQRSSCSICCMRGCGDSQNLRGQEILRSLNCTNKNNCLLQILGEGSCLVSTCTYIPKYLNRENLLKPDRYVFHM